MNRFFSAIIIFGIVLSLVACSSEKKDTSNTSKISTKSIVESQVDKTPEMEGKEYEFKFNPYVLTSEYKELYGDEFIETYKNFVFAYLNYENYCSCPKEDYAYLISSMQSTNFPLFNADAYFDYDNFYNAQTGKIQIHYISESKEQHDEFINKFVDNVSEIIENNITQNDNELIKSVSLYHAFASNINYNYDALGDDMSIDVSPYNAIMNNDGICQSFAGAYTYLLLQLGIDANTCEGLTYDNENAHVWTILKLDGKYYFADPTFENTENGGYELKYFGITTSEREEQGNYNPEYFNVGVTNQIWAREYDVSDTKFKPLRNCFSFKIDHQNDTIICFDENGNEYITLNEG